MYLNKNQEQPDKRRDELKNVMLIESNISDYFHLAGQTTVVAGRVVCSYCNSQPRMLDYILELPIHAELSTNSKLFQ